MWLAKPDTPKSWLVQGFLSAVGTHQCFCLKVFEFFTAEGKLQRERQRRGGNNKRVTAKEGRREKWCLSCLLLAHTFKPLTLLSPTSGPEAEAESEVSVSQARDSESQMWAGMHLPPARQHR